jgi:hypothetical protein
MGDVTRHDLDGGAERFSRASRIAREGAHWDASLSEKPGNQEAGAACGADREHRSIVEHEFS